MMSKLIKGGLCVAALAMLAFATPEAQAQRRSSRGGGSWGGRSSNNFSSDRGGYGGYYGRGGYGRGGYGYGGYRGYGWGWDGFGYGYGYPYRSYWYGSYPDYYGDTYESDVYPSTTESYESAYPPAQQQAPNNARIRVHVPDPDAQIFFNGAPTQQRGMDRVFETPALDSGFSHTYEIRARWTGPNGQPMDQTRSVNVQAGRESFVNFE